MDIGVLVDESTFLPLRTVGTGKDEKASLVVDLKQRSLQVYFQLPILHTRSKPVNQTDTQYQYRVRIPFSQLSQIFQTHDAASGCVSQLTFLDCPPLYHRRINNIASTFIDDNNWKESDTWFRQTYVVHNPQELAPLPISLRKLKPVIDIGEYRSTLLESTADVICRPLECIQDHIPQGV